MKLPLFEFFFTFFDICYKKSNSRCEKYNRKKYRSIYLCSIFKVVHSIKHLFASKSHLKVCTLVFKNIFSTLIHTSQESFYKWTKISSLEINILGFVNNAEKWSIICFEIHRAPSEIPANLTGQFSPTGQIFLHWAAANLKWLGQFQNKFQTTFHHHF